jgi:methionyl aminopeptidase
VSLGKEEIDCWRKAGILAAEALAFGRPLVKAGASYLAVVEAVEDFVRRSGGELAFPVNISINAAAAHDTPVPGDPRVFSPMDLVKLDVGVHVSGYIGDNAVTVDLSGQHQKLCEASRQALHAAVAMAIPGTRLRDIGREVENTISSFGFQPIKNLGGHQLGVFKLHCGAFVPNYFNNDKNCLDAGMVLAIEPFAAENCNAVEDSRDCRIFNILDKTPRYPNEVDPTLGIIRQLRGLPFSLRSLEKKLPGPILRQQFEALAKQKLLHYYPPLITKTRCLVSQHEHTVIVANPPLVTTQL